MQTEALGDDGDVLDPERGAAREHVAQWRGLVQPEERVFVDEGLEAVPTYATRAEALEGDGASAVEEETTPRGRRVGEPVELSARGGRREDDRGDRDDRGAESGSEPTLGSYGGGLTIDGSEPVLQRRISASRDGALAQAPPLVEWYSRSESAADPADPTKNSHRVSAPAVGRYRCDRGNGCDETRPTSEN